MRLEATPDGVRITLEHSNQYRQGILETEEHDFTVAEAEAILQGLPGVLAQAKEMAEVKRHYELRNLRSQLARMEGGS